MVMDLGRDKQGSLELLRPWCYHMPLGNNCDDKVCRSMTRTDQSAVPRCAVADPALDALLDETVCTEILFGDNERNRDRGQRKRSSNSAVEKSTRLSPPLKPDSFAFSPPAKRHGDAFDFKSLLLAAESWLEPKRTRHGQDVDGPNTAALSCKKRRLRAELITSRLSQPYSLPATHILNREGMKSGDKRFLKMATSIDVARRIAHLHATSFLRYSVMNRLRRRLGLGAPGTRPAVSSNDDEDGDGDGDDNDNSKDNSSSTRKDDKKVQLTSQAPLTPPSLHAASGARYLRPSRGMAIASSMGPGPSSLGAAATVAHSHGHHHPAKPQACRLSQPAALPLPPTDLAATKIRTSPRIHAVRSPEWHSLDGDADEDSFAFLHLDEDALAEGDEHPDSVYSDFGVIFGGGNGAASGAEGRSGGGDDTSYEEYLDELDGISWVTR